MPVESRKLREGVDLYYSGQSQEALRLLEKAAAVDSVADAYAWQGVLLRRLGRREEALAALRRGLLDKPGLAWAHGVLGEVLREMGARRRGYAEIQKTIQLDPACRFARDLLLGSESRFEAWVYACRGGTLRAQGDLEAALPDLLRATALDSGCGWAWGWLGELHLRAGRCFEAIKALDRAAALFPEWPEAFAWRGEAKRMDGEFKEALKDLDHAVALGYKQYDVFLSRASARQALGDGRGHITELTQAVRSAPEIFRGKAAQLNDLDGSVGIGAILGGIERANRKLDQAVRRLESRRESEAIGLLRQCVEIDPGNAKAHLMLCEAAGRLKNNDEAMRAADEAVRLDPCAATYGARAVLAQSCGYMESALRDISLALALSPGSNLYRWRARAFLGMRHYDLALRDLSAALELDPDDAEMYDLRAHVNLLLGRLPRAQEDLERALRILPRQVNLHLRLAQLLALRGGFQEAHHSLDSIRRAAPAWAHFAAGYIHCLEKRYDLAAAAFQAALDHARKGDEQLTLQARFYGTIAKAFSGLGKMEGSMSRNATTGRRRGSATGKGKIYLCGLGVYPPQTATVEVLRGIGECDVIFNNLPGLGISEFLGLFCANRRPVAFRYEQDAKLCADLVLSEVRPGRTVGFVTFGHPLLFGPLSHEIIQRCGRLGIPWKAFGAVSSMDAVLAASGQVLGYSYGGYQLFETTASKVFDEIAEANPRLPVVIYFADGMGEQGLAHLVRILRKIYSASHRCLLYGPKHELWEHHQEGVTIGDLSKTAHHKLAQGILFVPPK